MSNFDKVPCVPNNLRINSIQTVLLFKWQIHNQHKILGERAEPANRPKEQERVVLESSRKVSCLHPS